MLFHCERAKRVYISSSLCIHSYVQLNFELRGKLRKNEQKTKHQLKIYSIESVIFVVVVKAFIKFNN